MSDGRVCTFRERKPAGESLPVVVVRVHREAPRERSQINIGIAVFAIVRQRKSVNEQPPTPHQPTQWKLGSTKTHTAKIAQVRPKQSTSAAMQTHLSFRWAIVSPYFTIDSINPVSSTTPGRSLPPSSSGEYTGKLPTGRIGIYRGEVKTVNRRRTGSTLGVRRYVTKAYHLGGRADAKSDKVATRQCQDACATFAKLVVRHFVFRFSAVIKPPRCPSDQFEFHRVNQQERG